MQESSQKRATPYQIPISYILKPSGTSVYTPRIYCGNPCASVNINRSVSASGFSPGLGFSGESNVIWTHVRRGNRLKNWSDPTLDLKSTRLNSSHSQISYADFGLETSR